MRTMLPFMPLQDQVHLYPLSVFGKPSTPPPGKVDPSIDICSLIAPSPARADSPRAVHNIKTELTHRKGRVLALTSVSEHKE